MESSSLKRTPLYKTHLALGAKMMPFGGWEMPLQYRSILQEHRNTRENVSLFDTCHMGEIEVLGEEALALLQRVCTRNLADMEPGRMRYSLLCDEQGGILDDCTVYRIDAHEYMVVTNAATTEQDYEWLLLHCQEPGVAVVNATSQIGKLDLQGPRSRDLMRDLAGPEVEEVGFYRLRHLTALGVEMLVSRSGYTGEWGYELYFDIERTEEVWEGLLEAGRKYSILPAGLGARDTLRLEAGFPLYGSDLTRSTTPLEAGLERYVAFEKEFIGREALLRQRQEGVRRRLVGLMVEGREIIRAHHTVWKEGRLIGEVTSGTFSPSLQRGIGLAYLEVAFAQPGTEVEVQVRERRVPCRVVSLPFLKGSR